MTLSKYKIGDCVTVRPLFPLGHVRTPYFIRGHEGIIDQIFGPYSNPEELAYGRNSIQKIPLYRVKFVQKNLWENYSGEKNDTLIVDVYEHWLEQ